MAKQKRLPGTEPPVIKELIDAAEDYVDARDQRMALTTTEKQKKELLMAMMKKHKQKIYRANGKEIEYTNENVEDVKVHNIKKKVDEEE